MGLIHMKGQQRALYTFPHLEQVLQVPIFLPANLRNAILKINVDWYMYLDVRNTNQLSVLVKR